MTMFRQAATKATLFALGLCAIVPQPLIATAAQAETAIAPEKNPPGDIPDSQVRVARLGTFSPHNQNPIAARNLGDRP